MLAIRLREHCSLNPGTGARFILLSLIIRRRECTPPWAQQPARNERATRTRVGCTPRQKTREELVKCIRDPSSLLTIRISCMTPTSNSGRTSIPRGYFHPWQFHRSSEHKASVPPTAVTSIFIPFAPPRDNEVTPGKIACPAITVGNPFPREPDRGDPHTAFG